MTTRPTDDSVPRDPRVDAAWRAASNEEPPPALDAAILAAARREAGAKPQSLSAHAAMHARRRWWPLAAAATVAVIAIGVVQRAGHDELGAPPGGSAVVTDMPAPSAKSAAASPQSVKEAAPDARADAAPNAGGDAAAGSTRVAATPAPSTTRNAESVSRADAPRRTTPNATPLLEKKSESAARDAAALPEPFPAASPKLGATTARDSVAPSSALQGSPPSAPVPPAASFAESTRAPAQSAMRPPPVGKTAAAGAAEQARLKDRAPLPIPDWIALIRRLRDEGKTADAERELAAFRAAHADHERLLPPDLRDWRPAEK